MYKVFFYENFNKNKSCVMYNYCFYSKIFDMQQN